jgi:SAM-dependent methyltransferase
MILLDSDVIDALPARVPPANRDALSVIAEECLQQLAGSHLPARFARSFAHAGQSEAGIRAFVTRHVAAFAEHPPPAAMIPQRVHRIWITDPDAPHLPPATYLANIAALTRALGPAFIHRIWTNAPGLQSRLSDHFTSEGVPVEAGLLDELAMPAAIRQTCDALIAARKFVLAADIMKIIVLQNLGGIYADMGVVMRPGLFAAVAQSDMCLLIDPQMFFQLSFLAAPAQAPMLALWSAVLARPESLAALLHPDAKQLNPVQEVELLAGPGFTSCVLNFAPFDARLLILPYQGTLLQWGSQRSWYPGAAKFGNVAIDDSDATVLTPARLAAHSAPELFLFGKAAKAAARIKLLLGLRPYFEQNHSPLCRAMSLAGSDKALGWHNYTFIYHWLLQGLIDTRPRLLEIGIGTNFTDTPSSMGEHGVPGASLRAWRDYFRTDRVFGADLDRRVLFTEPGIETLFVDQTQQAAITALAGRFDDEPLSLIIDDGLHEFSANLACLNTLSRKLRPGGIYIIEDVALGLIPQWQRELGQSGRDGCIVSPVHQKNKQDNCFIVVFVPE